MNDSSRNPEVAEAVRQKRLRLDQLEKLAETRTSLLRFGATAAERDAKYKRAGRGLLRFVLTLAVISFAYEYYLYFVEPLIDAEFAPEAMRLFAWTNTSVAGMIGLLFFYHKNPVQHLSKQRRVVANVLRFGGGGALLVASILFWSERYVLSSFVALGSGLMLWFARSSAKVNARNSQSVGRK